MLARFVGGANINGRRCSVSSDARRDELLAELDRLTGQEDAIRAQRSMLSYRLEQTAKARDLAKRELAALAREDVREDTA